MSANSATFCTHVRQQDDNSGTDTSRQMPNAGPTDPRSRRSDNKMETIKLATFSSDDEGTGDVETREIWKMPEGRTTVVLLHYTKALPGPLAVC